MLNPLGKKVEQPSTKLSVAGSILMMEFGAEGEEGEVGRDGGGGGPRRGSVVAAAGAGAGAGAAVVGGGGVVSAASGASLGASSGFSGAGSRGDVICFVRFRERFFFKVKLFLRSARGCRAATAKQRRKKEKTCFLSFSLQLKPHQLLLEPLLLRRRVHAGVLAQALGQGRIRG